ncbi:hypothetical protein IEQ34_022970 [Dendrobium chrysotoxum]|uniref:Uncharacterized protein n=1 Tax=Dendrobium chrysotoxum TaxID=161865 RepID=A0AAV7FYX9_DENCH|nr:hypothetical protein IEQ34_022970 [Dendrobium chrysotoxum]
MITGTPRIFESDCLGQNLGLDEYWRLNQWARAIALVNRRGTLWGVVWKAVITEVQMGDPSSHKIFRTKGDQRSTAQSDTLKTHKVVKDNDVVPEKSDRTYFPPQGYLSIYVISMRAGYDFHLLRNKRLDIHTRDLSKSWANGFFFVKNDWNLLGK